jgi:nuclear pore complex protein Nup98-Nup96
MQQSFLRAREEDVAESPFKQNLLGQSTLGQSYLAQKSAQKSKISGSATAENQKNFDKSQAFNTSMDIMGSLWNQEKSGRKSGAALKGFEV